MTETYICVRCGKEGQFIFDKLCRACEHDVFMLTLFERLPLTEGRVVWVLHKGRPTGQRVMVLKSFNAGWFDRVECATITGDGFGKVVYFQRTNLSYL